MMDAIICPDCGVNADTCRCARPVAPHAHTRSLTLLHEADATDDLAWMWADFSLARGQQLAAEWHYAHPARSEYFTYDAAGRLTWCDGAGE